MDDRIRALSMQKPAMDEGMVNRSTATAHSRRMLNELHALNFRFIELIARDGVRHVPAQIAKELPDLSHAVLQRVAQCPFSLFNLAFEDTYVWDAMFDRIAERRHPVEGESSLRMDFAKAVVMFVWHMLNGSESGQIQARLLLGLQPRIATRLAELSLPALLELGMAAEDLVRPRWVSHPRFWLELVRSAAERQPHKGQAVRLLGRQLLAADALCMAAAATSHSANHSLRHR